MIARMTGVIKDYAWGSATIIPELLGREPTGEPQAELWLGAHPSSPATVNGMPLDQLLANDPTGLIGAASVEAFGPRLPFLLKVLAADRPLSLQAHPTREQAEAGYEREQAAGVPRDAPDRIYRDGWPKPELLCALVPTDTLCGFREPAESYALFEQLGVAGATALVAELGAEGVSQADRLESVFAALLRLDDEDLVNAVVAAASAIDEPVNDSDGLDAVYADFLRTARELGEAFAGDPGVLAALLMNRVSLAPYEAIFLPAGNLHAYLHGAGIETMANSDNVLRGGLTAKHVDAEELLAVLDFTPGFPGLVEPIEESPGLWRYPAPAPEFAVWRIEGAADQTVVLPGLGAGRVLLVTDGAMDVISDDDSLRLERGESAFLGASESVSVQGAGRAFLASPDLF